MDIVMPFKSGIEATKEILAADNKATDTAQAILYCLACNSP